MADNQNSVEEKKMQRGRRLAIAREHVGFKTQSAFAREVGLQQGSYADVERGRANLSADLMEKLVNNFKINLSWIFTGEGEMLLEHGFYGGGEPTREQIETLYRYVLEKRAVQLSPIQELKFKMACARSLLDNPHLRTLRDFGIAADVYLNFILRYPDLTL